MELKLEKLKAPIEMHIMNGVPHLIMLQTTYVFFQHGNWKGKEGGLVGLHLRRDGMHFGNEITNRKWPFCNWSM
jgi:hypothetical protein